MSTVFYTGQPGPQAVDNLNLLWDRVTEQITGTSTTSLTIGLGAKSLTTQTDKQFALGQSVRMTRTSDVTQWMQGTVTSYVPATGALSVSVDTINGSGTFSDWTIALQAATGPAGPVGPQGAASTVPGPTGPAGPTGAASTVPGPPGANGTGTGTVTSISVTAPLTVSNATTTPALTLNAATTSTPGSMSGADKTKIDAQSGTNTGDQTLASLGAQASLVSGSNIKTINGANLLGSGDLVVGGLALVSVTGTTQAVTAGNRYSISNAAATTLTAPSAATAGQIFAVANINGLKTNSINWNGLKHEGLPDATMNLNDTKDHSFIYINAGYGWKVLT